MEKPFRVMVFGKTGCEKCKLLIRRLERLLADGRWQDFELVYADVETEDGLMAFCRAQCINPNRIPALVVMRRSGNGAWEPVPRDRPGAPDAVCGASRLYQYVGLQTDYSESGGGVITPRMLEAVLAEAQAAAACVQA